MPKQSSSARKTGWVKKQTTSTAKMESWTKGNDRINYWPTTGTMSSRIKHPKRKHATQMYRRNVSRELLGEMFANPRKHTGKGYYRKKRK